MAEDDVGDTLDLYSLLPSLPTVSTLYEAKGVPTNSHRGRCLGIFRHQQGLGAVVAAARRSLGSVAIRKKHSGAGPHMAVSVMVAQWHVV